MRTALVASVALVLPLSLLAQDARPSSPWSISLGAGAIVAPRYVGSDEHRVLPIPMLLVTYRDRIFVGPATGGVGGGIGAHLVRTPRFGLTAELAMTDSRPSGRSDALVGTDDRDALGLAGLALGVSTGPLRTTLSASHALNDGGGWLGSVGTAFTHMLDRRLIWTTGVNVGLADARQLRRDFGVNEEESARRQALIADGDPRLRPDDGGRHRPDGGIWQAGGSTSVTYLLSQRWAVTGFGGVSWLADDIAESPLVRQREQVWGGLSLMWRR